MRSLRQQPAVVACLVTVLMMAAGARAADFDFQAISDLPGGPGQGSMPSINSSGDIAFVSNDMVYFYDATGGQVINVMTLTGAPAGGWFPRLNDGGDIAFIDPGDRHVWLFEADTATFSDLATLPGFPGLTGAYDLFGAFDLNNNRRLALHAGDVNFGSIYLYDHGAGTFTLLTGLPGGYFYGRDCRINNADQVTYNGGADIYIYTLGDGTSRNITDLPGGPGSSFSGGMLNDSGDIAISSGSELVKYTAADESFWYLSTLAGFPVNVASVDRNGLADDGAISFWSSEIYYFDPTDSTFTQLTNQGVVPFPGHQSVVNSSHRVAFEAGGDIWLASPAVSAVGPVAGRGISLAQNRPNPFNPQTQIAYEVLAAEGRVLLEVFDLRGNRVRVLVDGPQMTGMQSAVWDGRDQSGRAVSSGTYFYRLRAGNRSVARTMQLVR